jgi:hypothetical protein
MRIGASGIPRYLLHAIVLAGCIVMGVGCRQPTGPAEPTKPEENTETTTITIDFDNATEGIVAQDFAGAGLASEPAPGQLDSDAWSFLGFSDGDIGFGGSAESGDFARGVSTGGVTTGGLYGFEIGESDTGLGIQPTAGDFAPGSFVLRLARSYDSIETVTIQYSLWTWNDQDRSTRWSVAISSDEVDWYELTPLECVTTMTADGEPVWVEHPVSATIVPTDAGLGTGDYVYLRWNVEDYDGTGGRDECAIDDLVITIEGFQVP